MWTRGGTWSSSFEKVNHYVIGKAYFALADSSYRGKITKVTMIAGGGSLTHADTFQEGENDLSPFTFGSQNLVPQDEDAIPSNLLEHQEGQKDDLRDNDPESPDGVLDRTDSQWRIRNAKGEYGYGFWFRFLGMNDGTRFLSTLT